MSTVLPVFQRILVGVDYSDASRWATELAGRLAATTGGTVALLHVVDVGKGFSPEFAFAEASLAEQLQPAAKELLDRAATTVGPGIAVERLIREGDPRQEIIAAAAKWGADLIIVGTHGHGRLARLLLGSTAEAVVRSADCPVLTVGHDPKLVEASRERVQGATAAAGAS